MPHASPHRAVDYLIIGHIARDGMGPAARLGGTAAYAGLTAAALGQRVGLVTSTAPSIDLKQLSGLDLADSPAPHPTSFENQYSGGRRLQKLLSLATPLGLEDVPAAWRHPPLVHLAPIAGEVDPSLAGRFPNSFVGITAQGWLRGWDQAGLVHASSWEAIADALPSADAVVVSVEDLAGDRSAGEAMAAHCRLLVVTDGPRGAMVFQGNDVRHIPAPASEEVDPTGAGDVFAAAFFVRLTQTGDPWKAARFANRLATASITLEGVGGLGAMVANLAGEKQALE
ncbi:MAG TPA: PfkB family carbohydrate kinase [Anaerolineales bacterium]|nr:PfkB family carbohydrate kinase [Anaerolineales bacterium]